MKKILLSAMLGLTTIVYGSSLEDQFNDDKTEKAEKVEKSDSFFLSSKEKDEDEIIRAEQESLNKLEELKKQKEAEIAKLKQEKQAKKMKVLTSKLEKERNKELVTLRAKRALTEKHKNEVFEGREDQEKAIYNEIEKAKADFTKTKEKIDANKVEIVKKMEALKEQLNTIVKEEQDNGQKYAQNLQRIDKDKQELDKKYKDPAKQKEFEKREQELVKIDQDSQMIKDMSLADFVKFKQIELTEDEENLLNINDQKNSKSNIIDKEDDKFQLNKNWIKK